MDVPTAAVAITGIVASGILGPILTSVATRAADTRKFARDLRRADRNELRDVLDEAATLLSAGPRILRRAADKPDDPTRATDQREWSDRVYPMRERLALRLSTNHPVVAAYDSVRETVRTLAKAPTDEATRDDYDAKRDAFLVAARQTLDADLTRTNR